MDSPGFRYDVQDALPFARNPIYAILHEACYADGHTTDWSAERVQPAEYAADVTLFTGEHVFSWMFDDYGALAPLQAAADLLAKTPWPALYNPERLAHNEVPVAAAIYADDVYVESGLSLQTARVVRGMRPWLTNEYEHNGLRADGGRILNRLINLTRGLDRTTGSGTERHPQQGVPRPGAEARDRVQTLRPGSARTGPDRGRVRGQGATTRELPETEGIR
jgi:hypothetical protein